jgi:hypothetical protein
VELSGTWDGAVTPPQTEDAHAQSSAQSWLETTIIGGAIFGGALVLYLAAGLVVYELITALL